MTTTRIATRDEALALLLRPEPASVSECEELHHWLMYFTSPAEYEEFTTSPEWARWRDKNIDTLSLARDVWHSMKMPGCECMH